jgi:hypothetical protein
VYINLGVTLAKLTRETEAAAVWGSGIAIGQGSGRDPTSTATLVRNLKKYLSKEGRTEEATALITV